MDATSFSLLERLQSDAQSPAWQRLVELYDPLIRHWLRRHEVLAQDADDLAQEVLAVLVRRIGEFEHNGRTGAFRAWIRAITANCLRDFYSVRRNRPLATGSSSLQDVLAEWADPQSSISRQWDDEHDRLVTRRLMEMLRSEFAPTTWKAFEGLTFKGQTAQEVATDLGVTPNAVYIARSRVLARLRQEARGLIDRDATDFS